MMTTWSKGRYIAQTHRVVHKTDVSRISLPFFYNPDLAAKIDGMKSCYAAHLAEKLYASVGHTPLQFSAPH